MSLKEGSASVVVLIEQLANGLTNLFIDPGINKYSEIRRSFTKSSKDCVWSSLLDKGINAVEYHEKK